MRLSTAAAPLHATPLTEPDAPAVTCHWHGDLAQYLKNSEFVCRAVPYSAPATKAVGDEVLLPLHACCVVSAVQFGQIVSYTPQSITIEFRSQGIRQTTSIPAKDLAHYLRRNGFELVAHLPSGLHRIASVQAP